MNDPKDSLPVPTSLDDVMPSVVAVSQRKSKIAIAAFLAFMGIVAIVVCKKPAPKNAATAVPLPQTAPSGPSLPPPMAYSKPSFPLPEVMTRRSSSEYSDGGVMQVRRNSPMVIFNKNNQASGQAKGGGPSDISPMTMANASENNESGVPVPGGFQATNAPGAHASAMGDRDYIVAQGKMIDAVLETAINSDHPGMLRAIISHDVYGDTGALVLLPRGSRLIGQYDSAVAKGQSRVFVIWQRAIRPDGIDIHLESGGTDTLGRTGIEGDVNHHFFAMFGAAALLSVIGASAATIGVSAQDQNNSIAQYRSGLAQSFNSAANTVLGQYAQIKPTISVNQGVDIKVFVGRDLYFDADVIGQSGIQVIP